ncbi:hypothetical protein B0A55_02304 [Friedmanniomyces simplex]|uniref:tyrosinase n=1 Tax=Friedmanniomyces simplex TaxID=329884 RepID=A0A4U0XX60_9PEZI|nr:hypothetical protein B0A55_02304 [Friedmanniomyces simplex]
MRLPCTLSGVLWASTLMRLIPYAASLPLSPLTSDDPTAPLLQRRQSSFEVVSGIQAFGIQPRLEIRQLEQNADQWNIYLLGLAKFQATNQSDKLSYYQIAGIHGRPYTTWDGAPPAPGVYSPGYCAHVSNVFLTWHRPYLALFEQTLYQHIVDAVNEFPAGAIRQRYASVALSWRLPYWDWAATPPPGQSVYPTSVTSPNVTVTMPNGTATIENPLYAYNFHPVTHQDFYFDPFASWNQTMRFPTNWTTSAVVQDNLIGPILDNNRVSFQDRLYNLLTYSNNFTEFGNEAWMGPGATNQDSLESLHDAIHSITGGSGHMTYLDYSAFDPLFWLHHAMIDRSFALWQAINNDSYVEPMATVDQTYNFATGQVVDVDSALEPFHSDAGGDYWTSTSVRSIRTLGYTYADLGDGSVSTVKTAVNTLYGSSAGSSGLSKRSDLHAEIERELPGASEPDVQAPTQVTNGKYQEYLANIVSQKFALNGSYAIYVFMGDFDDTPSEWSMSPNLVGTHAVFAALSGVDAASNPQITRRQMANGIQVSGTLPLTSMLLAKVQSGELPCMDIPTVTVYLNHNLHWRVGDFGGSEVPVKDVADLAITVVSAEVEPATAADEFPTWGDFTVLTNVTEVRHRRMSPKPKSSATFALDKAAAEPQQQVPKNWPEDITYLTDNTYSTRVTADQRTALSRTLSADATWTQIPAASIQAPTPLLEIRTIADEKHPAVGQRGLFATQHLAPDAFICLYLGHVHTNSMSDQDPHSDYDLSLDPNLGLSVDAAHAGNESRFTNDYRGIAERPNAEFRDCYVEVACAKRAAGRKWERRVAVFVLSAGKAGKRKAGVGVGEEVLVSYGKGYWEGRRTVAGFRGDEGMVRIAQLALDA